MSLVITSCLLCFKCDLNSPLRASERHEFCSLFSVALRNVPQRREEKWKSPVPFVEIKKPAKETTERFCRLICVQLFFNAYWDRFCNIPHSFKCSSLLDQIYGEKLSECLRVLLGSDRVTIDILWI
jgi:hypothetical protein